MLRRASARAAVVAALSAIVAIGTAIPALAAVPKITSFSPISGPVGTSVTVLGSSFTGVTGVAFNGTSATYTVISANQINTTVPAAATTGPISVTNASGTAISSSNFTVTPPPASITVTPTSGPPTSTITVSGAGFGATEAVDVYFDTTDEALASTNGVGSFSGIPIPAPSTAVPGMHWVTGVGRHSGLAAQAPFTVQSDWAQFRFSAKHRGQNPYENVLSTSNVSNIDLDWSFHTPDPVESSPAVAGGVAYFGSNVGAVYAVNASTGTEGWASEIGQVASSPADRLRRLLGWGRLRPERLHRGGAVDLRYRRRRQVFPGRGQRQCVRGLGRRQRLRPQRLHRGKGVELQRLLRR